MAVGIVEMSVWNVGLNVGLNKTEKAVLGLLLETPDKTAEEMASEVGVTKRTIERAFASLQKKEKLSELVLREMACGWL